MCGGGRGVLSKQVLSDGCLEEMVADLGFEEWIESRDNRGCPGCTGVRVHSEKSNTYSHYLSLSGFPWGRGPECQVKTLLESQERRGPSPPSEAASQCRGSQS